MVGWTDGMFQSVSLNLYSDADFAGCQKTNKSTSGVYLSIEGPRTRFPISALSKKQTCVSHSTPEAEIVAGAYALRHEGLPGQVYFDAMHRGLRAIAEGKESSVASGAADPAPHPLIFHGDNEAMIQVCRSGRNPTMRHLGRTHGISITWLHDETTKPTCTLRYIETSRMAADIFTKFFPHRKKDTWDQVRKLINVLSPDERKQMVGSPGEGWLDIQEKAASREHGEVRAVSPLAPRPNFSNCRVGRQERKSRPSWVGGSEIAQISRKHLLQIAAVPKHRLPQNWWIEMRKVHEYDVREVAHLRRIFVLVFRMFARRVLPVIPESICFIQGRIRLQSAESWESVGVLTYLISLCSAQNVFIKRKGRPGVERSSTYRNSSGIDEIITVRPRMIIRLYNDDEIYRIDKKELDGEIILIRGREEKGDENNCLYHSVLLEKHQAVSTECGAEAAGGREDGVLSWIPQHD